MHKWVCGIEKSTNYVNSSDIWRRGVNDGLRGTKSTRYGKSRHRHQVS